MCANSRFFLLSVGVLLLAALPAAAGEHLGAHFRDPVEFNRIIDLRCTGCHTRERIDAASDRRETLEQLMPRMVERGAMITEPEKEVLGTFWGTPMKERKEPVPVRP